MILLETTPLSNHAGLPDMPTEDHQDVLVLDSRLSELSRAQAWAEELAHRYLLSEKSLYSMRLCVEEALANIVLHGYKSESGHPIVIRNWFDADTLFLGIEDEAPAFVPSDATQRMSTSEPDTLESLVPGGYGIRLIRHFANSLLYERLPEGNRLTIGFSLESSGE
jgi:anti-sigma regulatory factor (Ser/Thr protein kinase)